MSDRTITINRDWLIDAFVTVLGVAWVCDFIALCAYSGAREDPTSWPGIVIFSVLGAPFALLAGVLAFYALTWVICVLIVLFMLAKLGAPFLTKRGRALRKIDRLERELGFKQESPNEVIAELVIEFPPAWLRRKPPTAERIERLERELELLEAE